MKSVLLIDDNDIDQKIFELLFDRLGIPLFISSDSMDGIVLAKQIMPSLILIDLRMPGVDGMEALSIISQDNILKKISIVMTTADNDPKIQEEALLAGAKAFLIKPVIQQLQQLQLTYHIIEGAASLYTFG